MKWITEINAFIARTCLAFIFILSGIGKIAAYQNTLVLMKTKGIPATEFFLYVAVLLEVAGGLCMMIGFRARIAALALFFFLIPTTYLFHFKVAFDAHLNVVDSMEMIQVLKNVAIMGGLLLLFTYGPGKIALGKDQ